VALSADLVDRDLTKTLLALNQMRDRQGDDSSTSGTPRPISPNRDEPVRSRWIDIDIHGTNIARQRFRIIQRAHRRSLDATDGNERVVALPSFPCSGNPGEW
jgi:hypothetical protein